MRVKVGGVVLVACITLLMWPASLAGAAKSWPFGYTESSIDQGIKGHLESIFKVHNLDSVSCVAIESFRPGNVFHCTAYNNANALIGRVTVKILKGNRENISWKPTSSASVTG
jgi:hypothetical protein